MERLEKKNAASRKNKVRRSSGDVPKSRTKRGIVVDQQIREDDIISAMHQIELPHEGRKPAQQKIEHSIGVRQTNSPHMSQSQHTDTDSRSKHELLWSLVQSFDGHDDSESYL